MSFPQPISLENSYWQVGILPETGASVAFSRIRHNGQWVDLLRPTPESSNNSVEHSASFVMLPWASRIADATFRFRGKSYPLRTNHPAGYAMHGIGRDYPWRVDSSRPDDLVLTFQSVEH